MPQHHSRSHTDQAVDYRALSHDRQRVLSESRLDSRRHGRRPPKLGAAQHLHHLIRAASGSFEFLRADDFWGDDCVNTPSRVMTIDFTKLISSSDHARQPRIDTPIGYFSPFQKKRVPPAIATIIDDEAWYRFTWNKWRRDADDLWVFWHRWRRWKRAAQIRLTPRRLPKAIYQRTPKKLVDGEPSRQISQLAKWRRRSWCSPCRRGQRRQAGSALHVENTEMDWAHRLHENIIIDTIGLFYKARRLYQISTTSTISDAK